MKLQFVSYDNIDIIKSNLKEWVEKLQTGFFGLVTRRTGKYIVF